MSGERELTTRALVTGLFLGALLAPCNVYSGLKIGWSFNMSITALLLAYAFWVPLCRRFGWAPWGMLESNINQTCASSAASIISGGLVAPLPALAMISGENLPLAPLAAWVFSVSFLGIWIGWYLRGRLIERSALVFPAGMATAETLSDMFSRGKEAMARVRVLLGSLAGAALINFVDDVLVRIPRFAPSETAGRLTFQFDPSLLLLGFGSIIGLRAGAGLLAGALLAWGVVAPWLISTGQVDVSGATDSYFQPLVGWLLWPGVAMMVTASLSSVVFSMLKARGGSDPSLAVTDDGHRLNRIIGLTVASALVVVLQTTLFDVHLSMAVLAVPMAFLLATVAARVVGETGIPPIGAAGKVSQLTYGVLAPGQVVTNLMTANVSGGAAGQTADLLNDLKAGHTVGATASHQIVAQCVGVLTGSLVGSAVYLALIRNPTEQLLTTEWPAPAVATWKAVAETLSTGLDSIPNAALVAMTLGAIVGLALSLIERHAGKSPLRWVPSGATVGLAFVIPASISMTLFLGSLLGALAWRYAKTWAQRFLLSAAAGLVAGESLYGVIAVWF